MQVDEKTLELIKKRRNEKAEYFKNYRIGGKEIEIPSRSGKIRCLYYMPDMKIAEKPPVFFDIHGGGFNVAAPERDDAFCTIVSKTLGICVISVDYPLAPEHPYPEEKKETFSVIQYVYRHPDEFGIDNRQMAVGGHSSGGNIAAVMCMMAAEDEEFSFKALIMDYPPMDLKKPAEEKFYTKGAIPRELANAFDLCYRTPEQAREPYCSPLFAEDGQLKKFPPSLMLTCEIDSLRDEGEEFGLRLVRCGVPVTMKRFQGVRHAFTEFPDLPASQEAYQMMCEFLEKYLLH